MMGVRPTDTSGTDATDPRPPRRNSQYNNGVWTAYGPNNPLAVKAQTSQYNNGVWTAYGPNNPLAVKENGVWTAYGPNNPLVAFRERYLPQPAFRQVMPSKSAAYRRNSQYNTGVWTAYGPNNPLAVKAQTSQYNNGVWTAYGPNNPLAVKENGVWTAYGPNNPLDAFRCTGSNGDR